MMLRLGMRGTLGWGPWLGPGLSSQGFFSVSSRCVHGKCVPLDALSYSCQCQDGYSGALCSQAGAPADPCGGLQCLRGHCQALATAGAHCVCDPGFSGDLCEQGQGPPS